MNLEARDHREDPGVDVRLVLILVGGFTLMVAVAFLGFGFVYGRVLDPSRAPEVVSHLPIPELQPNPTQDYAGFRRRQNLQLAGYTWVDHGKGLIHIPIERAMAFIVARGPAALDPLDATQVSVAGPPDGAPRAKASLPASPYGTRP
jgi:hypothetical protein